MNTAQKMSSKSSTEQEEEVTTEGVPGSIVIYTEEEMIPLIAMLNFQCFRLDTSFLSILPQRGKKV